VESIQKHANKLVFVLNKRKFVCFIDNCSIFWSSLFEVLAE